MMSTDYNIKHKHHTSGNNVAIEIRLQCTGSRKKIQIEKRTKTAAKNWRAIRGLGMHSRRAQWKASILTISVIRYFLGGYATFGFKLRTNDLARSQDLDEVHVCYGMISHSMSYMP